MKPVLPRTEDRCMGECCERFVLRCGGVWRNLTGAWLFVQEAVAEGAWSDEKVRDFEEFLDRLVPIEGDDGLHFRCSAFDPVRRECSVYETRSQTCRRYGTQDQPCEHPNCRWKDAVRPLEETPVQEVVEGPCVCDAVSGEVLLSPEERGTIDAIDREIEEISGDEEDEGVVLTVEPEGAVAVAGSVKEPERKSRIRLCGMDDDQVDAMRCAFELQGIKPSHVVMDEIESEKKPDVIQRFAESACRISAAADERERLAFGSCEPVSVSAPDSPRTPISDPTCGGTGDGERGGDGREGT